MLLTDFACTAFSLLHDSVFDQCNGIFSTTRVLEGRDPGDIGHFLVAIRQWKPPTVKTTGKRKRKERNTRGVKKCCLCVSAGFLTFSIATLPPSSHPLSPFLSRVTRLRRKTLARIAQVTQEKSRCAPIAFPIKLSLKRKK